MRLKVSPLCVFAWRNGQLVSDDPLRHQQRAISLDAARMLIRFGDWTDPDDLCLAEQDRRVVDALAGVGLLVDAEPDVGVIRSWGTAATYYHLASRTHADTPFMTGAQDTAWLHAHASERPEPPNAKAAVRDSTDLPEADDAALDATTIREAFLARRSTRCFDTTQPLSGKQIGTLLRWISGPVHQVATPDSRTTMLKASPSGGARHSIEVYPVVLRSADLTAGIYRYQPGTHQLAPVSLGDIDRDTVLRWAGDQPYIADAAVLLVYTSALERTAWKYRNGRAYRTILMDVGHVSQTAYLTATALGLGVVFTAATRDESLEKSLGVAWTDEAILGLSAIGYRTDAEADRQSEMLTGGKAAFSFAGDEWDGLGHE
jgi:SagB-type dehydrogenase family enzyme